MKKILVSLVAILMLTACGEMKIDSSTNLTYKESIENMKNNLSVYKSKNFTEALENIFIVQAMKINKVPVHEVKGYMIKDGAIEASKVLNGKTADEVISMGKAAKNNIECAAADDMIELITKTIEIAQSEDKIKELEVKLDEKVTFHDKNCF